MIPDVPRGALLDAMENFDKELRTTKEWANWEQNHAHKYAIVHDGRQYPVKQIIHMATGADKNSFSGGDPANSYVQGKGFSTVPLRNESTRADGASIRDGLVTILARYASARANDTFAGHKLWDTFKETQSAIETTEAVGKRSGTLRVRPSMGQGQWVTIPWIALFDLRETNTIQRGAYCVYLFREDMSGVYLALAQGVTEPKKQYGNTALAREHLRARAKDLRQYCGDRGEGSPPGCAQECRGRAQAAVRRILVAGPQARCDPAAPG